MRFLERLFISVYLITFSNFAFALTFTEKAQIKVTHPSFLHYVENSRTNNSEIFISSFGLTGHDHVSKVLDLRGGLSTQSIQVETLIPKILWPNEIKVAPESLFGAGYLIVAEGFLVPFKGNGAIELYDQAKNELRPLTKLKKGYWYHRVEFWDYNHDGRLDIITARAKKGMMGGDDGELVALIAPTDPIYGEWKEVVLLKGPDVFFRLVDFDHDSRFEVISAEFLSKKLTYYFQDAEGKWQENVIDKSIGNLFDLQITDINSDGHNDLLVTNHVNNSSAGVFGFEIPTSPKEQAWPKHILYQGFVTSASGVGQASPGVARTYYPTKNQNEKPFIVVSGDGSESAHLLSAVSQDKNDWNYRQEFILKTKGMVGQLEIGDADQNGLNEIYIPEYDQNRITVLEPFITR